MRVVRALSLMPPAMELLGGIGMAAALWYGSNEIATGRLTTGDFTSFLAAMLMMYAPAKKLSRVNANLQQAIAAADRIFEMLDTHTEVAESPNAAAAAAVLAGDRVPRRHIRVRGCASARDSPRRHIHGAGGADGGDRRPQRRRQDDAREPDSAVLTTSAAARLRSTATTCAR